MFKGRFHDLQHAYIVGVGVEELVLGSHVVVVILQIIGEHRIRVHLTARVRNDMHLHVQDHVPLLLGDGNS